MLTILPRTLQWSARAVALLLALILAAAHARNGDNDPAFVVDAWDTVRLPTLTPHKLDVPVAAVRAANGDLVVAASCDAPPYMLYEVARTCLRRLSADGTLDTTYGAAGFLLPFSSSTRSPPAGLFKLPDGRMHLIAVCDWYVLCQAQLFSDGTIDPSYGTAGVRYTYLVTANGFYSDAYRAATGRAIRLSSGNLAVVSQCHAAIETSFSRMCVSRLLSNGALDRSFAGLGWLQLSIPGTLGDEWADIAETPDGGLLVLATCYASSVPEGCAIRLDSTGQYVSDFGVGGRARLSGIRSPSAATTSAWNGVERWVVAGHCGDVDTAPLEPYGGCIGWFSLQTGALEMGMGQGGIAMLPAADPLVGRCDHARTIARWHDGSLFVGANCPVSIANSVWPQTQLAVSRFLANGSVDSTFGVNGTRPIRSGGPLADTYPRSLIGEFDASRLLVLSTCSRDNSVAPDTSVCVSRLIVSGSYFDLDRDTSTRADTDGVLYLRWLLGVRGNALTTNSTGQYAARRMGTEIQSSFEQPPAEFAQCTANIVGSPTGATATLDGLVLLRAMLGLTGDAVTSGIYFPPGTARTSWGDIRSHLVDHCGMLLSE